MNTQKYRQFHLIKEEEMEQKRQKLSAELPAFCEPFFKRLARSENKAISTLVAYATDLKVFFIWAKGYIRKYEDVPVRDLPIDILTELHSSDIDSFMTDYIPMYASQIIASKDGDVKEVVRKNSKTTSARKLSTLKKFYHFYNNQPPESDLYIENDPVSILTQKRDTKQPIKFLSDRDTQALFSVIDSGDGLGTREKKFNEKTRGRDRAIIALFLGTGIRVSELAGINIQDIDWEENSIKIFRKEHREDTVYMSAEVKDVLWNYVNGVRLQVFKPDENNENALFLSFKHNRMSVSAIERCVKKYTQIVTGDNSYSCHKLRDTFGTRVYAETGGNAKKVQIAMNHKSAATTLDYYVAAIEGKEKEEVFKSTHIEGL